MNGDSEALLLSSCDSSLPSTINSPSNTKTEHQQSLLFMEESDASTTNYTQLITSSTTSNNNNNNSGLLRYRSAPSSLLENYISDVEKSTRLNSRFCSDHEANGAEYGNNNNNSNNKAYSQLPPQYPRHNGNQFGSMGMDHLQGPVKMGSGLMRQNSSPAGFFSQNGYVVSTRGIGSYRMADGGANGLDLSPSSSRLRNNTMNFSSGMSPSLGILSRIAEVDEAKAGNNSIDNLFYSPGFEFGPWNDTSNFGENFTTGIKRELDNDLNLFPHLQGEPENRPHILSHHLSLPRNSAEMANVEKLLHFQDTIPCKIRAKRGCATHPRSIAERVRRTKISERMRKLQDLVPNMDKQTNTADMLDLAVEYIKNLQKEYKTLSENRANCKCLPSQKTVLNQ